MWKKSCLKAGHQQSQTYNIQGVCISCIGDEISAGHRRLHIRCVTFKGGKCIFINHHRANQNTMPKVNCKQQKIWGIMKT